MIKELNREIHTPRLLLTSDYIITNPVKNHMAYTIPGNLQHNLQIQSLPVEGLCNSTHQCFLAEFFDPQKVPGRKGEYLLPVVVLNMAKDRHL